MEGRVLGADMSFWSGSAGEEWPWSIKPTVGSWTAW